MVSIIFRYLLVHIMSFIQVFYGIEPEHIFCTHPKLLFSRDIASPGHPCRCQHWFGRRRAGWGESLCQVCTMMFSMPQKAEYFGFSALRLVFSQNLKIASSYRYLLNFVSTTQNVAEVCEHLPLICLTIYRGFWSLIQLTSWPTP